MRRRLLLRIADAWIWLRSKYETRVLFSTWPWRWLPTAKRRTP